MLVEGNRKVFDCVNSSASALHQHGNRISGVPPRRPILSESEPFGVHLGEGLLHGLNGLRLLSSSGFAEGSIYRSVDRVVELDTPQSEEADDHLIFSGRLIDLPILVNSRRRTMGGPS